MPSIRKQPFLLFGLPFTLTIVGAAYGLSYLTQTRYDYNATKVQSVDKAEELRMRKDRKRVDLREEYFRLATGQRPPGSRDDGQEQGTATWDDDVALLDADQSPAPTTANPPPKKKTKKNSSPTWGDDWEPIRVPRPEGTPEWGVPSNLNGAPYVQETHDPTNEQKKSQRAHRGKVYAEEAGPSQSTTYDLSKAGPPDARGNRTLVLPSGKTVVLGPDGKPCRACNTKLAFAEAMRGVGGGGGDAKGDSSSKRSGGGEGMIAGFAGLASKKQASPACPPDVEALGRSSWDLIHSIAATYPEDPSPEQRTALFAFLKSLPVLYPCGYCAESLKDEYQAMADGRSQDILLQEAAKSHAAALKFTCRIHNEVNGRLGKKQWDCEDLKKLKERWLDGGAKCL